MTLTVAAQKSSGGVVPENDSADLDQCRNGNPPEPCTGANWVNGNVGSQNSHYAEKDFIAYRMKFDGLAAGTNVVVIGYDRIHSGVNAIDYLGSYDHTETNADACSGIVGFTCTEASPTDTAPTPTEPLLAAHNPPIPQIPGVFKFWGATFNSAPVFVNCGVANETLVRCVRITFTPNPGVDNPVLAWGGHIAWRGEWGAGQSAGGISGSPYHMRLEELNGTGGNQDRSLSADAVFGPGSLRVIKSVSTFETPNSVSTIEFDFTASQGFVDNTFTLIDDDLAGCGPLPNPVQCGPLPTEALSDPINTFNGVANVITVTEDTNTFPVGWSLAGVACTVNGANTVFPAVSNSGNVGVTVTVPAESVVVCTFLNSNLVPSAAHVSISGRTVDSFGNGIGGSRITVMDPGTGEVYSGISNPFGYYTVEGMEAGNFYFVTVSHKRYTFADNTRTYNLDEDLHDVDFIANPLE